MDVRIGNAQLNVEGIKELKKDVKIDDALKNQLQKDGYDEIIYKQGDKLFIAYGKNMDLDKLKINLSEEGFSPDRAYEPNQLTVDGEAVDVQHKDDENKESFWVAPYKEVGRGAKELINDPIGKSVIFGTVAGLGAGVTSRVMPGAVSYSGYSTGMKGVMIGTGIGATAGGLRGAIEIGHPGAVVGAAAGYLGGYWTGIGSYNVVKSATQNPKVTGIAIGTAAAVVGASVLIDKLSDNNKPATMRVINRIAQ